MKTPSILLRIICILAFFSLSTSLAVAQSKPQLEPETSPFPAPVTPPDGTVSCFDHYRFGSVRADLAPSTSNVVSGTRVTFNGTLENTNPYPIVDGGLYVKIFKMRSGGNDGNGHDVVDQFLVKGDIVIPAKGSVPVTFSWNVPSYAVSGDYSVATFFTSSRKFNLLGLTFTDDVIGSTVPFKVVGEREGSVQFAKDGVTVNDKAYHFAAVPPRVSKDGLVTISAHVVNSTSVDVAANIEWKIYQWDAQLRENVVDEVVRAVRIPAQSTQSVSIDVRDSQYPVYLAVGTLVAHDTKSIIGVRFVREGIDRTRINFPGVSTFPLRAGEEATLFSCLHNAGSAQSVPNARLVLTLSDASGDVIREYTYAGDVTGAMMGVADAFTPTKDYDYFTLDARLYNGNEFIDEANLVYDCQSIDSALCFPKRDPLGEVISTFAAPLFAGIIVIILIITMFVFVGRRKAGVSGSI